MNIYTGESTIEKGYIKIQDQKIKDIGLLDSLEDEESCEVIDLQSGFTAVPGFIDLHIHGVDGADVMDATNEALVTMSKALPREGTTSFLATTMTQSKEAIEAAIRNAGEYISGDQPSGQAEIVGIHLEGPFVNKTKAGAQPLEHIIDPDTEQFKKWNQLSGETVKLVTLAPERPGGLELVKFLKEHGVIASIGHTNATFHEVEEAIEAGATHITHLFNQMRGLHHREPGVAGAALLREELLAEIIADGVHVNPEMVKLAYKLKGKERIVLITDSMRAKCLKNGHYDLGGQDVIVQDGKAVLSDGTLAGSILKLGHAVKNIMAFTGCSLEDAVEMASINPAKQLNIFDRKGSLETGKDADIVILDQQLDVAMTFCNGRLAYSREENKTS